MVPAVSKGISPVPPYSGYGYVDKFYSYRAITFFGQLSQVVQIPLSSKKSSYNPSLAVTILVWASPCSLATTYGITFVFSSSGYLDVSVLQVCSNALRGDYSSNSRVAPFGNLRINTFVQLPVAYRSLTRPSSPIRSKAFPIHP